MNRSGKKSVLPYIPGYDNNAILKLVFFIAGAYILLALTWAVFMIVNITDEVFSTHLIPNIALPTLANFKSHWWTVLTYGLFHFPNSFMNMLSNMLWLYAFGSVVQMLIGKKQIVPLYVYSMIVGGIFYIVAQLLPGGFGKVPPYMMGPQAGMAAMCAAALTLTPKYRFYLTEYFSIPIMVVAGIFAVLMVLSSGYYMPVIVMLLAGAASGFVYVRLLQAGYRPGEWMGWLAGRIEGSVTPGGNKSGRAGKTRPFPVSRHKDMSQERIDEILDKINQKGFSALSKEERDILKRAGKS